MRVMAPPQFTAIVLSADPVTLDLPGVAVLARVQKLHGTADMHAIRLDALQSVQTPYCFYLDSDDELPADYLSVLEECAAHGKALAYTDELVVTKGVTTVHKAEPYDRDAYLRKPMMIHGLAVMETRAVKEIEPTLPRGIFWTQLMLFSELAKRGAAYVARIGYIWHRGDGFNTRAEATLSQVRSLEWARGAA